KAPNVYTKIEYLNGAGSAYLYLGKYKQALFYLRKSYQLADSLHSSWFKKNPIENLYRLYARTDDYENAVRYQYELNQITIAENNKQIQRELKFLESRYEAARMELKKHRLQLTLIEQEDALIRQRRWLSA